MANLFSTDQRIFEEFNQQYGDCLVSHYPLLGRFQVKIYSLDEYLHSSEGLPEVEIQNQFSAFFVNKENAAIETTNAGIIYNESLIRQLGLTESEQFAAIAHEIGHILYFFLENKRDYPELQGEEIYADKLACEIGLSAEMLSTIEKLERSGISRDPISQFGMRKCMIINVFLK